MSLYQNKLAEALQAVADKEARLNFAEQSKKISQLIAKSWLPGGEEIKKIFIEGNSDNIKKLLKKEGIYIEEVFSPLYIYADWDTFYGKIAEVSVQGGMWLYNLPYPPRPNEVTDAQLQSWVDNQNPNQEFPPYPYIPLTAC